MLENHLRHIALVVDRKQVGAESTPQRALDPLGCGCGALRNDEVDDDLQIAGAHGDLHTALLVSSVGENASDRRLARAEQAKQSSLRRMCGDEEPLHRFVLHDAFPEPAELIRRPRERNRYPPTMLEEDSRRRAGEAQGNASGRKRRLLPNARLEVGVRHAQPVGDRAGDGLDLGVQTLVDLELPPCLPGEELDGPVVMRRAESSGDDAEVRLEPLPEGRAQLLGAISDDHEPFWSSSEPGQLAREESTVVIAQVSADELAAGEEDERSNYAVETVRTPFAVTTTIAGPCGKLCTRRPLRRTLRLLAAPTSSQSFLRVKRFA